MKNSKTALTALALITASLVQACATDSLTNTNTFDYSEVDATQTALPGGTVTISDQTFTWNTVDFEGNKDVYTTEILGCAADPVLDDMWSCSEYVNETTPIHTVSIAKEGNDLVMTYGDGDDGANLQTITGAANAWSF